MSLAASAASKLRFRGEAEVGREAKLDDSVENDTTPTCRVRPGIALQHLSSHGVFLEVGDATLGHFFRKGTDISAGM
jgi:hypothetical protein